MTLFFFQGIGWMQKSASRRPQSGRVRDSFFPLPLLPFFLPISSFLPLSSSPSSLLQHAQKQDQKNQKPGTRWDRTKTPPSSLRPGERAEKIKDWEMGERENHLSPFVLNLYYD